MWRKAKNWTTLKYTCALPAAAATRNRHSVYEEDDVVLYLAPLFRSLSPSLFSCSLSLSPRIPLSLSLTFPSPSCVCCCSDSRWVSACDWRRQRPSYLFFLSPLPSFWKKFSSIAKKIIFSPFFCFIVVSHPNIRFSAKIVVVVEVVASSLVDDDEVVPRDPEEWDFWGKDREGTIDAFVKNVSSSMSKKQTKCWNFFKRKKAQIKKVFVNYGFFPWWVSAQSVRGPKVFVFVFNVHTNFNVFNVLPLPPRQQQQ